MASLDEIAPGPGEVATHFSDQRAPTAAVDSELTSPPTRAQETPAGAADEPFWRRALEFESNSVLVALIVMIVVIGGIHPDFFSRSAMLDILQQSSYIAIMAGGMAFLISMREIDLSVGSMFGLTIVLAALLMKAGVPPWVAGLMCIPFGAAMGLLNAGIVQGIKIPAIVATLATLSLYRGLSMALTKGQQVPNIPVGSSFFSVLGNRHLGVPSGVFALIATAIVLSVVLRLTPFGYRVRGIGSNPDAATFSGISIPKVRIQALVLMGGLCGVAGVFGLAFFQSGDPNFGAGLELQVIAAAVIGGTPLRGGRATVAGAVFGAILLTVVNSGLIYFGIPINWSSFATGFVILVAVSIDSLVRRRRRAGSSGLGL